ncbi:tripartite tricarboxylate transporter TctB family protein [Thermodesulfobacteriota bacterium]
MKTEEKVLTYFLFLIVILMVFFAFGIHRPGAKTVPLIVGVGTLILMILLCLMTILPKFASWYQQLEGKPTGLTEMIKKSDESENDAAEKKIKKREIAVIGWLLFLTAATYVLGFLVAIPLFLFLFLKLWAKEGWLLSLGMSSVVFGVVFLIFAKILQIPLHAGIIFG